MAWKSWRAWVGYGLEVASVFIPGVGGKVADAAGEKLEEAERERKEREAAEAAKEEPKP